VTCDHCPVSLCCLGDRFILYSICRRCDRVVIQLHDQIRAHPPYGDYLVLRCDILRRNCVNELTACSVCCYPNELFGWEKNHIEVLE